MEVASLIPMKVDSQTPSHLIAYIESLEQRGCRLLEERCNLFSKSKTIKLSYIRRLLILSLHFMQNSMLLVLLLPVVLLHLPKAKSVSSEV